MEQDSLPMIIPSNWRECHDQGWRFCCSLPSHQETRARRLLALQEEHGKANVTIGMPWSRDQHGPILHISERAAYVRDVDALVEGIHADIKRLEEEGWEYDN